MNRQVFLLSASSLVGLASVSAKAGNISISMTVDPPASPSGFHLGEIVGISLWLNDETTDVNGIELAQVDLHLTGATIVPEFDPNDMTNPIYEPVVFGGGPLGDGQMGGADGDALPGPPLPGCPANCLVGSVPSSAGGGTIFFWARTSTNPAHLLNPPAPSMTGLLFLQFKVQLLAPLVTINALGPCLDDGSSSGAFFQQAGTGIIWQNCDIDSDFDNVNNIVGGVASCSNCPEPAHLCWLGVGALAVMRRRVEGST